MTCSYDFDITLLVDCDWFGEIQFRVNNHEVEGEDRRRYEEISCEAEQIRDTLNSLTAPVA